MARRIIGLDLGAYSVKLLRLETGSKSAQFEIQDVVEVRLPEGEQEEELTLLERQQAVVKELSAQGLLEGETFVVGLSSLDGQMGTMEVPFSDTRKIDAVLPGLLEAEVPFDLSDKVVTWHRSGQSKPKEDKTSEHIRIAFGKKSAIANTLSMLQHFNIDPRIFHFAPAAPFEIVRALGITPFARDVPETNHDGSPALHAVIDFGHSATNICILSATSLMTVKTLTRGGEKLTHEIAAELNIDAKAAEELKHHYAALDVRTEGEEPARVHAISVRHHQEILSQATRVFVTLATSGAGEVKTVTLVGGGANVSGITRAATEHFAPLGARITSLENAIPEKVTLPQMVLAFAYAISGLHLHAKDSRFNFRTGEFVWRGDLDFLRAKSGPLVLWCLTIICLFVVVWFTKATILDKETKVLDSNLKNTCERILEQKNLGAKKCLTLMKEQVNARHDLGMPEFLPSKVLLDISKAIPGDLKVTITELDINDKKVKIVGEVGNYEDIDRVVASLNSIPCFTNVVRGRAQKTDSVVKFNLSNDIDCNAKKSATSVSERGQDAKVL